MSHLSCQSMLRDPKQEARLCCQGTNAVQICCKLQPFAADKLELKGGGGGVGGPPLGAVHLSIMISEWRNYKTPEVKWLIADPVQSPLKDRNMNE